MKKNIITITAVVCMFAAIIGLIGTKNYYDRKLADMTEQYEAQIEKLAKENNELETSITDMEEQVYRMMDNKSYLIEVHHGGSTYIYEQEKDGIFALSKRTVISK